LAFVDIAINLAVTILIGPDCAGKPANDRTGDRASKDAYARNHRTSDRTDPSADRGAGRDAAKGRIIARWPACIILSLANIAVSIAVLVLVGPNGASKAADNRADCGAFDRTDTADNCADRGTAKRTDARAGRGGFKRPVIGGARAERN